MALYRADPKGAAEFFEQSLRLSLEVGHRHNIACCLAGLAEVAAATKRPERAAGLFGAADALLDAIGAVLDPVDRLEYDRNLEQTRAQLGRAAFETAHAVARVMSLEDAIDYGLEAIQSPHLPAVPPGQPSRSRGPLQLTHREQEVAALAAQGLSNREIGGRLFITEGTARIHVERILGKLGLHSRAQLAAWLIEHRPVTGLGAEEPRRLP